MNLELAQYEDLSREINKRCLIEEEPADIHAWLLRALAHIGGGDETAILTWPDSFDWYDELLAKRAANAALPLNQRHVLDWPWQSWNRLIDPLEPGMMVAITAPDGQGKTIYVESLAEHWARRKHKVVFVHYELNRSLMLDRRTARHTSLTVRQLKGALTAEQRATVQEARVRLLEWDGQITYLHTPGWSMERTTAELRALHTAGDCDIIVIDYLEKAQPSARQMKIFGANVWQREADMVEQLKTFAESYEVPVVMVTQQTKVGKNMAFRDMSRNDIGGSGEKSNRANVVVLLKRERLDDGSYSPTVHVQVDKNTMGATGAFQQVMQPEYFRLGDVFQDIAS